MELEWIFCLKSFFSTVHFSELCTNDASTVESRLLSSLQLLLLLLPPANRTLLRQLVNLLNKTAAFESSNKMNCDTLATLFTPHLMCPRKLSPEALHVNSQHLSGLVAFMIRKGTELFEIPPKLATDIRAYWLEQERKLLSPKKSDVSRIELFFSLYFDEKSFTYNYECNIQDFSSKISRISLKNIAFFLNSTCSLTSQCPTRRAQHTQYSVSSITN